MSRRGGRGRESCTRVPSSLIDHLTTQTHSFTPHSSTPLPPLTVSHGSGDDQPPSTHRRTPGSTHLSTCHRPITSTCHVTRRLPQRHATPHTPDDDQPVVQPPFSRQRTPAPTHLSATPPPNCHQLPRHSPSATKLPATGAHTAEIPHHGLLPLPNATPHHPPSATERSAANIRPYRQ